MADAWCKIDRDEFKEEQEHLLQAAYKTYGMEGMKKLIEQSLDEWKDVPLYIGVAGRSGVGKSSFINAIRGLTADDDGAAEVGVIETTKTVQYYPHPANKNLVLCDLPGAGTKTFPTKTYFTDIGFEKFDLFLILTAARFMEDDLKLAQGIKERNKGFLFIRTKIHQDIENEKKSKKAFYRSNPDKVKPVIAEIRNNCEENLEEFFLGRKGTQRVFLIDNYETENPLYDFGSLTNQLIEDFPTIKRDALILSLTAMTPHIIEAKTEALRRRITKVCVLSALGGLIPIPGCSSALDVGIVLHEANFYKSQLGLEDGNLQQVANTLNKPLEEFKSSMKLKSICIKITKTGILEFCSTLLISKGVQIAAKVVIPVLGMVVGAGLSYVITRHTLTSILDMMVKDAMIVNQCITQQSLQTTTVF